MALFTVYKMWFFGGPQVYVGSSSRVLGRLQEHAKKLLGGYHECSGLQEAFDALGRDLRWFRFSVEGMFPSLEDALDAERALQLATPHMFSSVSPRPQAPSEPRLDGETPDKALRGASRVARVAELKSQGFSLTAISDRLGCSVETVKNALRIFSGEKVPKAARWETYGASRPRKKASQGPLGL